MACSDFLCICLALLYRKTPTKTRTVPVALRMVMWLLNTMMLSQMDSACLTVLATLRGNIGKQLLEISFPPLTDRGNAIKTLPT